MAKTRKPAEDVEDEFEEEESEDESFEEFDEDFEAAGPGEVKIKTTSGMDTFCLGWSMFATIAAICIITYGVLYQVYDVRMGVIAEKEIPEPDAVRVVAWGRDSEVSDVYNYAILNGGTSNFIYPGMIFYVGSPDASGTPKDRGQALVTLVVSEECDATICKAYIMEIKTQPGAAGSAPISAEGGAPAPAAAPPDNTPAKANDWGRILSLTEAAERLPLLLGIAAGEGGESGQSTLKCSMAPWGRDQQPYLAGIEEDMGKHIRKPRSKGN